MGKHLCMFEEEGMCKNNSGATFPVSVMAPAVSVHIVTYGGCHGRQTITLEFMA